ncbi:hypothetical protein BaRGS_00028970 [Batillaria attramentaria]|uniref:Rieske domain-containing protein n=1 Tax=Batillaria attramentaria TaxID=370345 RepID=A0ABD0JYK5_9CAEN
MAEAAESRSPAWQEIGSVDELKKRKCRRLYAESRKDVALFYVEGKFYATSAICPHAIATIIGGALTLSVVFAFVGIPLTLCGVGVGALGTFTNTGAGATGFFVIRKALKKLKREIDELNNKLKKFGKHVETLDEWEQRQRELDAPIKLKFLPNFIRKKLLRHPNLPKYATRGTTGVCTASCPVGVGTAIKTTVKQGGIIKAGLLSADDIVLTGVKGMSKVMAASVALSAVGLAADVVSVAYNARQLHKKKEHEKSDGLRELAKRLAHVAMWHFPQDPAASAVRSFSCSDLGSVEQDTEYSEHFRGNRGKGGVSGCDNSDVHTCAAIRSRRFSI